MHMDNQKYYIFGRPQATKPASYRNCACQCPKVYGLIHYRLHNLFLYGLFISCQIDIIVILKSFFNTVEYMFFGFHMDVLAR